MFQAEFYQKLQIFVKLVLFLCIVAGRRSSLDSDHHLVLDAIAIYWPFRVSMNAILIV